MFATGASGDEDLGETITMRYELPTPQKYFAQVKSKNDENNDSDDEDEEQQIAILAQRHKSGHDK